MSKHAFVHVLCGLTGCFVVMISSGCKSSKSTTTQPVISANRNDVAFIDSSASRASEEEDTFDATQVPGRIHRVQAKETLWSLSERYYGDGNHWRKILVANRKRLSDAKELPVGMILIIP